MRSRCLLFLLLLGAATTQPVRWHAKGVVATKTADLSRVERDDGIQTEVKDGTLQIDLPRAGYAFVLLTDQFDYSEKAVMQVNLAAIKGSFSVQAVCYDGEGKNFTNVDLLEYLEKPGTFEVPMKIYRTPLKGTTKIAFKFWLAGDHASARVSSLAYGMTE